MLFVEYCKKKKISDEYYGIVNFCYILLCDSGVRCLSKCN